MSWLRIERYVGDGEPKLQAARPGPQNNETLGNTDVRNSPMLCQQCGAAPCEPVCPVLATYHSPSGLNGMIYNRCIGTRYCSNNCPYKVRRFNWFDYQIETWPEPMPLMLEPGRHRARPGRDGEVHLLRPAHPGGAPERQGRAPRAPADGEVQTACQQTCATDAITFGNLKDAKSSAREARGAGAEPRLPRAARAQHASRDHLPRARPREGEDGHSA